MRTGKRKRLAALLLCLCMMVGLMPLSGTASAAELQDTQDNGQTQEETQQTAKTITAVAELEGDAARQTAPVGTERSGLLLPDKLTGTVDGKEGTSFPVTWECEAFDGNTPGEYTFTAILGEAYTTADNVTLPTVTVAVKAAKASRMLRGAANNNNLYEINNDEDWSGLQDWLDSNALQDAVVRIKAASSNAREIKVPNKNITIERAVPAETAGTLRLTSDNAVTLTIKNLKMSFGANGIDLASGSTLKFEGENVLTPTDIDSYSAAIHVLNGDMLTLTGIKASPSLTVTATNAGAGIGGMATNDNGEAAGTVNITGGKVTVKATHGAGIGGGAGITKGGAGGTVNISGASTVVDITMTGNGAGIGGGSSDDTGGDGGSATITGGTVKINAMEGAGIGGGVGANTVGGAGGMVKISGESTEVDITMADGFGAGIGGGGSNATGGAGAGVTIAGGKVTIKASYGAGIGGGSGTATVGGAGGTVNISGASTEVDITVMNSGAGIGGGDSHATGGAGGSVTITGGKVTIKATAGAGIGGGSGATNGGAGGTVEISGTDTVVDITMTGSGAGIGGGSSNATGGAGGSTTITGGKVTIKATYGAGIGGGSGVTMGGAGGTVNISGESTEVVITMTNFGAGIGGGGSGAANGGAGGKVDITGGTVTIETIDGAGIGGGFGETTGGAGGSTTIAGGTVTAISKQSAGIGGGDGMYKVGAGGTVKISDAYVTAESIYSYDIGAGGRRNEDFGTLTIDSTGTSRTVLDMRGKGTNAVLDHSIGTCQIKDATGALTGYYSKLTVTDGTASSQDTQKDYWKPAIFKSGSEVKLTADAPPQGKYFSEWTAAPTLTFADAEAVSTTFTMPEVAQAVTANYEQEDAPVISGDTSKDVAFGYGAASTDEYTVTGGPEPTVRQDEDYGGKIIWNDTTKRLDISEGLDVGKYPVQLTASNGVEPDAALTFTLTVEGIAPVITAQPQGAGYTAGQAAAPLAVAAEAKDGGTLSYQWYKNTKDSTTDGTKIDGAIDTEYKPDTGEAGTLYYYCVVTSSYGGQVPSLSTVSGTAAVSVTIPGHEVIPGPEDGKPLNLTKDGVFAFEGEFTNVAAIRINGHTLKQTPVSGTQARLSGYPGYASELGDVKEGSVIVTLYKEFLQTLPDGTYTLEVEFLDGRETSVAGTKFEIRQEKPKPTHDSKGSVATGDESLLWPWVLLMLAALAGGALAIGRKRRVQ